MAVMLCVPLTVSGRGLLASYNTTRLNSLTICCSVVRVYTKPITHLLLVGGSCLVCQRLSSFCDSGHLVIACKYSDAVAVKP